MTNKNDEVIGGFDKEYYDWISELSQRYRQSQIKAAVRVNSEMLRFYWSVGKDIEERKLENKYGSHFYENLSRDLSLALNNRKGLAPTSLWYAKSFYCLYSPLSRNLRQNAEGLENEIFRQDAEEFEMLFCIPWTHHQKIIDKVKGDFQKALFFVRKTSENNWGSTEREIENGLKMIAKKYKHISAQHLFCYHLLTISYTQAVISYKQMKIPVRFLAHFKYYSYLCPCSTLMMSARPSEGWNDMYIKGVC